MKKIYVFGSTNIDIQAFTQKAILEDSNPSSIKVSFGGVGRNIAKSIANYRPCSFISAFSLSPFMKSAKEDLIESNIDISNSIDYQDNKESIYLDIIDENGLVIGASDTCLIERFTIAEIREITSSITKDDIVFVDTNLNRECFEYLIKNLKGYKIVDAISITKLKRIKDLINYIDLIKVNHLEYEVIKDENYNDIIITFGDHFIVKMNSKKYLVTHKKEKPINPTGCGDSLIGAFIANIECGINKAICEGVRAAVCSVKSQHSVPTKEEIQSEDITKLAIEIKELYD